MAFEVELPRHLRKGGWKIKIRDRERVEPPHVTIIRRTQSWRWGLREQEFLDTYPKPTDVPLTITGVLTDKSIRELCIKNWDLLYPENPVFSKKYEKRQR